MYQDKTLVCRDCKQEFVFSAGNKNSMPLKGFKTNPPLPRLSSGEKAKQGQRRPVLAAL